MGGCQRPGGSPRAARLFLAGGKKGGGVPRERDEQAEMDGEDAALRLAAIVDAINAEREMEERVVCLELEIRKAKNALRNAKRRRQELAFLERGRRRASS